MVPHVQLFQTLFEDSTQQYADKVLAAQATFGECRLGEGDMLTR